MKHDFRAMPDGPEATEFLEWLEKETSAGLRRSYGDGEATKAMIFLYANRAYEAHMPEQEIGGLFGKCVVRAGYCEEEEPPAFEWLEHYGAIATRVHTDEPTP
jgi:hypothetical protein